MRKTKIISAIICTFFLFGASFPSASAVTWGDNVEEGIWFKYDISISFSLSLKDYPLFKFISLSYNAQCVVTVDDINSSNITFLVSNLTGDLSDVFSIENNTFIIPNEMLILPKEVLANDSITFGNMTLSFTSESEMNADKFWRGIRVKKADVGSGFLESFLPGEIPVDVDTFMLYIKYDSMNGWMYQLHGSGSGSISILHGEASFDISMIDASESVKAAMELNRDHSLDILFMLSFLGKPWSIVGMALIGIVIFALIVYRAKRKQSASATVQKKSGSSGGSPVSGQKSPPTKMKRVADKYRKGYKSQKNASGRKNNSTSR